MHQAVLAILWLAPCFNTTTGTIREDVTLRLFDVSFQRSVLSYMSVNLPSADLPHRHGQFLHV